MKHGIKRLLTLGIIFLILASLPLFYPYETVVVPEWKVQVVDENGNPLRNVGVDEIWGNASIESDDHKAESITDENGYVSFPQRTVRASALSRTVTPIIHFIQMGVHAGSGPYAYLIISHGMDYMTEGGIYSPNKPLPQKIVLKRIR